MRLIVSVKDAALQAALKGYPQRLHARVLRTINRFTVELQARVKAKLSGEVLHVRTGTLRRSINRELREEGGTILGIVGTNVSYAAAHEYGFDGEVTVKAHLRRAAGAKRKAMAATPVREHTRRMVLPERSFLRSALEELAPKFEADVRQAAVEALRP